MSSNSLGFAHGVALRRLASQLAEGAQYFVIGTKHLGLEAAKSTGRYFADFAQGLNTKHAPIDMERAAKMAHFTIVTKQPNGHAS